MRKTAHAYPVLIAAMLLGGCTTKESTSKRPHTLVERLKHGDDATAKEAIQQYVTMGTKAIPELRRALASKDPKVRRRVKLALGRITGQWGSDGSGVMWKRSLPAATGQGKPILVLHLFGRLDQEFC